MRGPRTVLGDRDANVIQSALATCIQSMRRSVIQHMQPSTSTCNCVGCGVAATDIAAADLFRCGVTQDRFIWVCKNCCNENDGDADYFFFCGCT